MSGNSRSTIKIRVAVAVGSGTIIFALIFLAYGNLWLAAAAVPLALLFPRIYDKRMYLKRKRNLLLQFKDTLQSVSASLSAGKSIENAIRQAVPDLNLLYCGQDIEMIRELNIMIRRLDMKDTIADALCDFAGRAELEDIRNFADVFSISFKSGGNMVDVIRNTCMVINQKIDIIEEIDILAAEKLLSFKIMLGMPVGFIVLMLTTSREYMDLLYTPAGNMAMTAAIAIIAAAWYAGKRITGIRTRY